MAPGPDAGLTLMEMMVVLAIIGVMTGMSVLGLGFANRGVSAEIEARRLADRIRLAADESLITQRPLALKWDERGYSFLGWDALHRSWGPSDSDALKDRRDLPGGMTLVGDGGGRPAEIDADGSGRPIRLAVASGARAWSVAFDGLNVSVAPGAASGTAP